MITLPNDIARCPGDSMYHPGTGFDARFLMPQCVECSRYIAACQSSAAWIAAGKPREGGIPVTRVAWMSAPVLDGDVKAVCPSRIQP